MHRPNHNESLTLGKKLVKRFPSRHKDPQRASEQMRGLSNLIDFIIPQSKADMALYAAGPIGRPLKKSLSALKKLSPGTTIGSIFKKTTKPPLRPSLVKLQEDAEWLRKRKKEIDAAKERIKDLPSREYERELNYIRNVNPDERYYIQSLKKFKKDKRKVIDEITKDYSERYERLK